MTCFMGFERDMMFKISDRNASIKYDETHTNEIPNVKLRFLFGFIICHKKGMPNNRMGYAVKPLLLLTIVNQYAVMLIK